VIPETEEKSLSDQARAIEPLAVNRATAALMLGICERKLWSMSCGSGEIPYVKIGTRVVYPLEPLRAWLAKQTRGGRDNWRNRRPQ